eukprot:GDKJ01005559.1.p1 GENE.GDKJ01005559.1~~GDKJ01005559.1.p1  ORF type:complete len:107 (-),score=3.08 GDKJ01005559.1:191-511(-)
MSCRTGRLPMPDDPLIARFNISDIRLWSKFTFIGVFSICWIFYQKLQHPHQYVTYKGPENPFARIRHKRYPGGGMFYGWGNNGLNRDCGLKEYECWAGYTGKEYTY